MSDYGIQIANAGTSYAFNEGYSSINFHGGGITAPHNGNIFKIEINCPTLPIIFYRSPYVNNLTAPHYVHDRGGGNYTVYTLGQAEIFVFKSITQQSTSQYGARIWGKNGKLVYDSGEQPLLNPRIATVSGVRRNQQSNIIVGGNKLAYNLHASAYVADVDFGNRTITPWRTVIQSLSGGFGVRLMNLGTREYWRNPSEYAYMMDNKTFLAGGEPISMMIIDVSNIEYVGMKNTTY